MGMFGVGFGAESDVLFLTSVSQTNDLWGIFSDHSESTRYSRFKYGGKIETECYAKRAAVAIETNFPGCSEVASPPIGTLPSASWYLARRVGELLGVPNITLHWAERPVVSADYAQMSLIEREEAQRSLSKVVSDSVLPGRGTVIINDVRVTGAQELALRRELLSVGSTPMGWLYLARLSEQCSATSEAAMNDYAMAPGVLRDMAGCGDSYCTARGYARIVETLGRKAGDWYLESFGIEHGV